MNFIHTKVTKQAFEESPHRIELYLRKFTHKLRPLIIPDLFLTFSNPISMFSGRTLFFPCRSMPQKSSRDTDRRNSCVNKQTQKPHKSYSKIFNIHLINAKNDEQQFRVKWWNWAILIRIFYRIFLKVAIMLTVSSMKYCQIKLNEFNECEVCK